MSLEELIDKITAEGFRINNLFQLTSGGWQANLHKEPDQCWEFGTGSTAKEALTAAYKRATLEAAAAKTVAAAKDTKQTPLFEKYVASKLGRKSVGSIKLEDL